MCLESVSCSAMFLLLIFLIFIQQGVCKEVSSNCVESDENMTECYKGKILSLILRNRGQEAFLPKLSGTYNVTAVQIGAILKHCKDDCQGIKLDVFGKTSNGLIVKCAELEPSLSSVAQSYVLCRKPMTVESLFVTIRGRIKDLVYLETYHLKFHYNMAMMEPPCPSSSSFPYVATKGEPCVFPFFWNNQVHYNCIRRPKSLQFVCATSCQSVSQNFAECLSLYPVPLFPDHSAIILSSKSKLSANPTAIIDRISANNYSECISTKNSEREALKGDLGDLNWALIDLQDIFAIQMIRLWSEPFDTEIELNYYSDIEVWISGDAPFIEVNKKGDGFQLSHKDKSEYEFCGKVGDISMATVSNVFNIQCIKPIVGRYVIIQKSRTALKFCEAEFYHNDKLLPCVVNGKATLDCKWKDEVIPVFAKKRNIYQSPTFSRFYILNSFNVTALPNCTKCTIAVKLMAQTKPHIWTVCGMQTAQVKTKVSTLFLSSQCMKNIFINKIKIFIYDGVVDLVKLRILLNTNSSLTPTYHQSAITRIQQLYLQSSSVYTSPESSSKFQIMQKNISPVSEGLSHSNEAGSVIHCMFQIWITTCFVFLLKFLL